MVGIMLLGVFRSPSDEDVGVDVRLDGLSKDARGELVLSKANRLRLLKLSDSVLGLSLSVPRLFPPPLAPPPPHTPPPPSAIDPVEQRLELPAPPPPLPNRLIRFSVSLRFRCSLGVCAS